MLSELTGLWRDERGYLSGKIGKTRIMILKNNFKEKENQPDAILYVQMNTPEESELVSELHQQEMEKEKNLP